MHAAANQDDHIGRTFAALADPTRRAMLAQLARGEADVSDLARPFLDGMSLPAITKHIKVLVKAGLVTKGRSAQWRPCKLNPEAMKDAADWMEHYRAFWEESFDRLEEYLKTVAVKNSAKKSAKKSMKGKKNARTSENRKSANE